jgi:aryl-alcohol dehydrogenase-like predicted oxidoreductase
MAIEPTLVGLAATDLRVGPVMLGTMTFGAQTDAASATAMVERSRTAGVTLFDTSNNYTTGASEHILGGIVAPFRDEIQLATKVGGPLQDTPDELQGLRAPAIIRGVEDSLRRLQTDRIDLYYFHRPDHATPIEESLEAAVRLVDAGKVRYLATSNFAAWQVVEMLGLSHQHGWPSLQVAQQQYNLLSRRLDAEYAAAAERLSLSTIAYNPLAGGLLTGKHRFDAPPEPQGRFGKRTYRDRYWSRPMFDAVAALEEIARDAGMSLLDLSFRWLLSRPMITGLVLGASTLEQLDANLAAIDGPAPDPETVERCDAVWEVLRGPAPDYNR